MPMEESKPQTVFGRHRSEPLPNEGCGDPRAQQKLIQTYLQRCRSVRLSILLVLLGASVFFWGLGYKLSLYENHGYTMPVAKLLSSNEDSKSAAALQISAADGHGTDSVPIAFVAIIAVFSLLKPAPGLSAGTIFAGEAPRPIPAKFMLSGLFFRPPPIHSVL